jgi:hypothetical protein
VLKTDLIYRPVGGDDQILVSVNLTNATSNVDGGFPGDFDTMLTAPAVNPACGDQLVLRMKLASGTTPYTDFNPTLTTP